MSDEMTVMIADMADRIEELEAENAQLKAMIADQINTTGDDPEIMAASRAEWAARAKEAEAKLEKALDAFDAIKLYSIDLDARRKAIETIAELTGDKDE